MILLVVATGTLAPAEAAETALRAAGLHPETEIANNAERAHAKAWLRTAIHF